MRRTCARSFEDLAFAELEPEARNSIIARIAQLEDVRIDRIARIADQLKERLAEQRAGSTPEGESGRAKRGRIPSGAS